MAIATSITIERTHNAALLIGLFINLIPNIRSQISFGDGRSGFVLPTEPPIETCTSPDGIEGQCVNLVECKPFLQLLKRRPVPRATKIFLRKSVCGFTKKYPDVCCPLFMIDENKSTTTFSITRKTTPTTISSTKTTSTTTTTTTTTSTTTTTTTTTTSSTTTSNLDVKAKIPRLGQCGRTSTYHPKIVGGKPSKLNSWPWVAGLGFEVRSNFFCNRNIWHNFGWKLVVELELHWEINLEDSFKCNFSFVRKCWPSLKKITHHQQYLDRPEKVFEKEMAFELRWNVIHVVEKQKCTILFNSTFQ